MLKKVPANWTEVGQPAGRVGICGRSGIGTHQGVVPAAKVKTRPSGDAGVASPRRRQWLQLLTERLVLVGGELLSLLFGELPNPGNVLVSLKRLSPSREGLVFLSQ